MRYFLDTEFNGFGGDLISLALVERHLLGTELYIMNKEAVISDSWVRENVEPYIDIGTPVICCGEEFMARELKEYLDDAMDPDSIDIIADWAADFQHFSNLLAHIGRLGGFKETIECTMSLINTPPLSPKVPHNALSDARALRDWWVSNDKAITITDLGVGV